MNILITGANGFIGRNLSKYLEKKYGVFKLVSKSKSPNVMNAISVDLTKHSCVKSFLGEFKRKNEIDTIIHLAAKMVSPDRVNDINILYQNLKITEAIVEIAKALKPKKIINFSSIAVYANKNGTYNETSEVRPSSNTECLYGLSKLCSENILDFMLRQEKINILHLRVSQVYGEGMRKDRVISMMLRELETKNTITVFGEGKRVSNFINIRKLLKITELFIKEDKTGIYNVGDERLSYLKLAQRLIKRYGNKGSKIIKKKEGSKVKFLLETTKIKELLK